MKKYAHWIVLIIGVVFCYLVPALGGLLIIVGLVMLFLNRKKKTVSSSNNPVVFQVAGLFYRLDHVYPLLERNKKFDTPSGNRRIYQYKTFRDACQLVPEPTNQHDKNAIMVFVRGAHVGYVPAELCATVRPLLKKSAPEIRIYGGDHKEFDGVNWTAYHGDLKAEVTVRVI